MESLLSIEGAARLLGISPWTVRRYIATKKIRIVRIGRRVLLAQQELQRIVNEGRDGAQTDAAGACQ
jgi:excisionase family DNA binding protein